MPFKCRLIKMAEAPENDEERRQRFARERLAQLQRTNVSDLDVLEQAVRQQSRAELEERELPENVLGDLQPMNLPPIGEVESMPWSVNDPPPVQARVQRDAGDMLIPIDSPEKRREEKVEETYINLSKKPLIGLGDDPKKVALQLKRDLLDHDLYKVGRQLFGTVFIPNAMQDIFDPVDNPIGIYDRKFYEDALVSLPLVLSEGEASLLDDAQRMFEDEANAESAGDEGAMLSVQSRMIEMWGENETENVRNYYTRTLSKSLQSLVQSRLNLPSVVRDPDVGASAEFINDLDSQQVQVVVDNIRDMAKTTTRNAGLQIFHDASSNLSSMENPRGLMLDSLTQTEQDAVDMFVAAQAQDRRDNEQLARYRQLRIARGGLTPEQVRERNDLIQSAIENNLNAIMDMQNAGTMTQSWVGVQERKQASQAMKRLGVIGAMASNAQIADFNVPIQFLTPEEQAGIAMVGQAPDSSAYEGLGHQEDYLSGSAPGTQMAIVQFERELGHPLRGQTLLSTLERDALRRGEREDDEKAISLPYLSGDTLREYDRIISVHDQQQMLYEQAIANRQPGEFPPQRPLTEAEQKAKNDELYDRFLRERELRLQAIEIATEPGDSWGAWQRRNNRNVDGPRKRRRDLDDGTDLPGRKRSRVDEKEERDEEKSSELRFDPNNIMNAWFLNSRSKSAPVLKSPTFLQGEELLTTIPTFTRSPSSAFHGPGGIPMIGLPEFNFNDIPANRWQGDLVRQLPFRGPDSSEIRKENARRRGRLHAAERERQKQMRKAGTATSSQRAASRRAFIKKMKAQALADDERLQRKILEEKAAEESSSDESMRDISSAPEIRVISPRRVFRGRRSLPRRPRGAPLVGPGLPVIPPVLPAGPLAPAVPPPLPPPVPGVPGVAIPPPPVFIPHGERRYPYWAGPAPRHPSRHIERLRQNVFDEQMKEFKLRNHGYEPDAPLRSLIKSFPGSKIGKGWIIVSFTQSELPLSDRWKNVRFYKVGQNGELAQIAIEEIVAGQKYYAEPLNVAFRKHLLERMNEQDLNNIRSNHESVAEDIKDAKGGSFNPDELTNVATHGIFVPRFHETPIPSSQKAELLAAHGMSKAKGPYVTGRQVPHPFSAYQQNVKHLYNAQMEHHRRTAKRGAGGSLFGDIGNAISAGVSGVQRAAHAVGNAAATLGHTISHTTNNLVHGIGQEGNAIAHGISDTVHIVGDKAKHFGQSVIHEGEDVVQKEKAHWEATGNRIMKYGDTLVDDVTHPTFQHLAKAGLDLMNIARVTTDGINDDPTVGIPLQIGEAFMLPELQVAKTGMDVIRQFQKGDVRGGISNAAAQAAMYKAWSFIPV